MNGVASLNVEFCKN